MNQPRDNNSERSLNVTGAPNSAQIVQNSRDITPLAILAIVLSSLGFLMGAVAMRDANYVAEAAASAARAQAKAETATARANVSELYAKQLFTEMNRLGYPLKTPAEDHAPQPSDNVSEEPGK